MEKKFYGSTARELVVSILFIVVCLVFATAVGPIIT